MRGRPKEKLDLRALDEIGKLNLFEVPDCMGKREEAWNKCETCPEIKLCSTMTLKNMFPNIHVTGG